MGRCETAHWPFGCFPDELLVTFHSNHVPSVDVLNRCSTFYGDSQLQSKRLMFRNRLLVGRLKRLHMVKSQACTHQLAIGPVSTMLRQSLSKLLHQVTLLGES